MDLETLTQLIQPHGQDHLLRFWSELDEIQKSKFSKEIKGIDYNELKTIHERAIAQLKQDQEKKDDSLKPLPKDTVADTSELDASTLSDWYNDGLEQVALGKMGVLLLAGGQGTRLGFSHPKGMYDVGLPSKKTLYQIQAERLKKLESLAKEKFGKDGQVTWYIMTSAATKQETVEFFQSHCYFGLKKENIIFFEQHTLPCLTNDGKMILGSKDAMAKAPDGNGGLYKALKSNNIVDDMEKRGIENIQVYCVDNILIKIADPIFTGYCRSKNADCGAKVVEKVDPYESVGVVCQVNGKYKVVEYNEISTATAEKRAENGDLTYNAANLCMHYFTLEFLQRILREHLSDLPHHVAKKKIPYVNESGKLVKPDTPSGMKMEKFVFDVFEYSKTFAVLKVPRNNEFSPLKNAPTVPNFSPISAKKDISDLHFRYIAKAGGTFVDASGNKLDACPSDAVVEVSPLLSYAGEGLESVVKGNKYCITSPIYLESPNHSTTQNGNSTNGKVSNGKEPERKKSKQE